MIIGDNLKQSIVSLFSSQFVVRVIRLGKRSDTQRVNKEGRPCRSLEEAVKIKRFISDRKTETINNFRRSRITDRYNILLVDDSVTIDIFIFDISGRIFAKLLFRRVCHIFIINKQTFGYVTISLAQLRTNFTSPWSSRVVRFFVFRKFTASVCEVTSDSSPPIFIEDMRIIQRNIDPMSFSLTDICPDRRLESHQTRNIGTFLQNIRSSFFKILRLNLQIIE